MFISSLAYTAAGAVVKKLFESGASSITQALKERFHGNEELLKLKDELEQRCRMLCLPVDACSHRVAMGNTVRAPAARWDDHPHWETAQTPTEADAVRNNPRPPGCRLWKRH